MLPSSQRMWFLVATIAALFSVLSGCGAGGPELIPVSGTVRMDGKPLADAQVRFIPEVQGSEPARPTIGRTKADGTFVLEYSTERQGVLPGKYRVLINTGRVADDGRKGVRIPGVPETVPDIYNTKSTLNAEVSSEHHTFDFDLESAGGRVVQPASGS